MVVQIFSRQGERVSPAGIAKIVDMTQLRVLADVDELHVARLAPGGKVEVTFRGSPTVYKGKISRVAPTVKRMQRVEPDGASSTRRSRRAGRDRVRRSIQHAAGAGTRDARHVPLMALILPDVPALRLRLLRLWSRVAQLRHWRPQFSLARVRSSARTATVMPLGVQQLKRQRTSTLLSLAGVTASLLVIFAQLGIERAVYESSVRLHRMVTGDLVVVPWGFKSMQLHAEVPVAVTDIVATNPSVASTSPFWFGVMSIIHSGIPTSRRIAWYAIDVERPAVDVPGLKENLYKLRETRRMLFDRDSRPYFGDLAEQAERGVEVPVLGPPDNRGLLHQLFIVGTFAVGPNVLNDGAVMMSETTMAEVFGSWWSDRPAFISVRLAPDTDAVAVRQQLNKSLVGRGEVITIKEFEQRERLYWSRETPVGYITDLGFVMGVMIGMVFIYYAQYQIIRFYLPEYAILKSLGYNWWFFFFMIGQIGAAIITPAFVLSFTLAALVYGITEAAMHLGMSMGLREMVVALVACVIMTVVSSLFAIRRLWKVDPIMLFE